MRVGFKGSFKRRALLAGLVVVALTLVVAPIAAAGPMTIIGNTYGHYYGGTKALATHVSVYASPGDESQTLLADTDSTTGGLFALAVDLGSPATYSNYPIWASAALFTDGSGVFDWTPDSAAATQIVLEVQGTLVKGTVKDAKTNKPLSKVTVTVPGAKAVKTSSKGKFTVKYTQLWPGKTYTAKFAKKGYKSASMKFKSAPGSATGVTVKTVKMKKK